MDIGLIRAAEARARGAIRRTPLLSAPALDALAAQGLAGSVPVSGQDADRAALNRIAQGTQTVTIWKDSRELGKNAAEIALRLAGGARLAQVPGATQWNEGPQKRAMTARFLTPVPITRDNLGTIIEAGWAPKDRSRWFPLSWGRTRSRRNIAIIATSTCAC